GKAVPGARNDGRQRAADQHTARGGRADQSREGVRFADAAPRAPRIRRGQQLRDAAPVGLFREEPAWRRAAQRIPDRKAGGVALTGPARWISLTTFVIARASRRD